MAKRKKKLLAYQEFYEPKAIYYWAREKPNSAEIDYLISQGSKQIPVEVKAGLSGKLRSLRYFLENHKCPFGVRISQKEFILKKIFYQYRFMLLVN